MNKLHIVWLAMAGLFALSASAEDTNMLKTDLGVFENRTGIVIIKAFNQVGSVVAGQNEIIVRCKESSEGGSSAKIHGLLIVINRDQQLRDRVYLDYEEVDPLLDVINYLSKITSDVTKLPMFEASYITKAGLRIVARSERRNGSIRFFLEYGENPRIEISPLQMTQLYDLVAQAEKDLNAIKAGK